MIGSLGRFLPAAVALAAVTVACSSTNPVYTAGPPGPGPSGHPTSKPTATMPGVTPSPTHTPAPTPTPTSTPAPTPTPTSTGVGFACSTTVNPLPGNYTSIFTTGNVSGTTYAQIANGGTYAVDTYAVATPSPSPSPTSTPTVGPTPTPTAAPTPVTYVVYTGAYSVPAFTGIGFAGPYSANATNGCFFLITTQNGQPIRNATYNADGLGFPAFDPNAMNVTITNSLATGKITSFTFTGLGPSSGTGTFTLDTNVTGSATVQGSQVITFERARRLYEHVRAQHAVLRRAPFRY